MIFNLPEDTPVAWRDLITAFVLLSKGQSNELSPTHCEHDTLTVLADPHKFTTEEITRLAELGFRISGHDDDRPCEGDDQKYCDAVFSSFKYGSA